MLKQLGVHNKFLGSSGDYEAAGLVLLGAPMDWTASFRSGSRHAPAEIRLVSEGLEEYSPYLDRDLCECCFYDAGDMVLPAGDVTGSLAIISDTVDEVAGDGKFPLVIGGEHLISLPVIKRMARRYADLAVIHLDAHADLREEYLGQTLSHATVMRQVSKVVDPSNIYQFGIRSGTREEFLFARAHTHFSREAIMPALEKCLPDLKNRPVYVTLDIDVVDPAFAPGTGTAEPGGCSSHEILQFVHTLEGLQVVGFDLVEVCPAYDHSQCTALLAAEIIREAILSFG